MGSFDGFVFLGWKRSGFLNLAPKNGFVRIFFLGGLVRLVFLQRRRQCGSAWA